MFTFLPGLTSIHRKRLSYNSIQQKSLSYNSIHQKCGETDSKSTRRQFRSFSMHCKCKTVQPLVLWVTKVLVTCVRLQTQPKICQKINLRTKNNFLVYGENTYHTISIYGKMLIIEFSYNFLYVWNCMKRNFPFMRIVR